MEEIIKQEQTQTIDKSAKSERHYGLDLLRIICMVMVLFRHISHYAFQSGIILADTPDFFIRQGILGYTNFLVDCFVLISAFFLVKQRFRLSRIFKLELIVCFWLIISFVVLYFVNPPDGFTWEYVIPFFPVTLNAIWFYTAYVGLYLLSPLLNLAIKHMNKGMHLLLCILLVLMSCLINNILGFTDVFSFANGHNLHWFVVLYFVGGYIRLYVDPKKIKIWIPIVVYVIVGALIIGDYLLIRFLKENNEWCNSYLNADHPYDYNSLLTFILSISIFLIFLKINFKTKFSQKTISFLAPHMFAIYILDRDYIRNLQCDYVFGWLNIPNYPLLQVILAVIIIFAFRVALDFIRSLLFKLFENRKWYKTFLTKMDTFPYWVVNKINSKGEKTV